METSKNYFEQMAEMQKQAMDSFQEASRKMMGSVGVQPDSDKDSSVTSMPNIEIFNDYMKQQQQLIQESMGYKDPKEFMEKAPQQFNKYLELQNDFVAKFFRQYQEMLENSGFKSMMGDVKMPEMLADSFTRFNKMVIEANNNMQAGVKSMNMPNNMMGMNMVPQMKNFMDAYNQMYSFWEPMQRFIQNGVSQPEAINAFFSQESFRKVMDSMMGFNPTEGVQKMLESNNKLFSEFVERFQNMTQQGGDMTSELMESMRKIPMMDMSNMMNMSMNMYKRLQQSFSPFTMVFSQGKEGKAISMLRDAQYDYASFLIKSAELQQKFYESGQKALPKVIKSMNEKFMEEKKMPTYEEFFNHFVDILENDMTEVLKSDEYAKLQGDVSKLGLSVKKTLDESMDILFENTPFVTRHEADDMTEEVHALREKVRALEEKLEEENKAASKKTASTASKASSSTTKKTSSTSAS